jgi:predicted component of type VI protein secretion system
MMNLRPHHRIHIPNTLAIFAVVLLLISSATGFDTNQKKDASGQQVTVSIQADNSENESINTSASKKSRGLNLGLLLFRRG